VCIDARHDIAKSYTDLNACSKVFNAG